MTFLKHDNDKRLQIIYLDCILSMLQSIKYFRISDKDKYWIVYGYIAQIEMSRIWCLIKKTILLILCANAFFIDKIYGFFISI